jgi:eukaryotic-like serine/threonine-protein kinase
MSDSSDGPTIDFRPPDTAPTLTRVGTDVAHHEAPANFAPPGYEILEELGRGGMGVVYKARQKSLNRLVALKVILGAGHAGADQLARFRAEATAAAQLQHPNIVQVFEVGEHDGQPFFSLELVDGGSLADRLRGEPQPPRDAAELVRTLALAVHHAHERGVVHRDLKPANVLLSSKFQVLGSKSKDTSDNSSGSPGSRNLEPGTWNLELKVTDFGLAKQRAAESHLTASGAILGTPSYMAPEQAAGDKAVGPAADVYALGAILYECLTGRPPFRAAAVMDTVLQVLHDDPVPPSRLQPRLPRDLETICLKCLTKKPDARYTSAAALADDLGRFLSGDTILARPASPVTKLWRWAWRHPAVATVAFVLAVPLPVVLAVMVFLWAEARSAKAEIEKEKAAADQARDAAARERDLAQGYLKNALTTMDWIMERIGDERLARIPAAQEARAAILTDAVTFYETLLRLDSNDPTVRAETAQTYARVSRVALMAGRTDQSAKAARDGVALFRGLADQFPDRPEYRNELAKEYMFLGHSHALNGSFQEGLTAYETAAALAEALAKEFPDEPSYKTTAADCRRSLGYFFTHYDPARGEAQFREAERLADAASKQRPESGEYRALLATVLGSYAQLLVARGRFDEAGPLVARGLELLKSPRDALPPIGPSRIYYDQAVISLRLAGAEIHLRAGRREQGLDLLQQAIAEFEGLIAAQPQSFPYRLQAIQAYTSYAQALREDKKLPDAVKATGRAVELSNDLHRDFPVFREFRKSVWFQTQRYAVLIDHAATLVRVGKTADAERIAREIQAAPGVTGAIAYNLACVYALLAGAADGTAREAHAGKAMALLKKAAVTGYPATAAQVEHIRAKDEDLESIRRRPEFQEWAKGLKTIPTKK